MVDNIDIRDTSIDIVKRLRQLAASDKDEGGPAAAIALTLEAARTIERLRTELRAARLQRSLARALAKKTCAALRKA